HGEQWWPQPGITGRQLPEMPATYSPELGSAGIANGEATNELAIWVPGEEARDFLIGCNWVICTRQQNESKRCGDPTFI
ncbi:MAG TPA: hypothetical protein VFA91_09610, partial [Candidatus Polarisedimenticolia bacterium]|nr:hypothetical protein [Candidatus Polarisedimenticolia bacterium]